MSRDSGVYDALPELLWIGFVGYVLGAVLGIGFIGLALLLIGGRFHLVPVP